MFNVQRKSHVTIATKKIFKKYLKMKKKPMMSQNVEKSPFTKSVKYVSKTLKNVTKVLKNKIHLFQNIS